MRFIQSLFVKLLLCFILLSTIPLALTSWLTLRNTEKTLNEKLQRETTNILDQKLRTLSFFLSDVRRMGETISDSVVTGEFLQMDRETVPEQLSVNLVHLMSLAKAIRPENAGMTLVGRNGLIQAYGYSPVSDAGGKIFDLPWVHSYLDERGDREPVDITVMHNRPYSSQNDNVLVFSYIQTIGDPTSSRPLGILIIDFRIEVLRDLMKNIFQMGDIYNDYASGVIITDREGQIIYPFPAGTYRTEDYERLKRNYVLIDRADKSIGWNFTAFFLKSELYKPIYGTRRMIQTFTVLSILVCLIVSLFLSVRMTKPIMHLRNLMKQVGQGDFQVHFTGGGKSEIAVLGQGFNSMVRRIQALVNQVYEEQNEKRRAEITAMQSQINPHFIYNTLESINSLARTNKQPEISRMIVLLGKLLRMSISTFDDLVPIGKELDYARHYLEIHKTRTKHEFVCNIDIDPDLLGLYTVKWILQPVIENAVIHGLDSCRRNGSIHVKGWLENDLVRISISDRGNGMSWEQLNQLQNELEHHSVELIKQHRKVGLYNVQARIRLYFGAQYGIQVESKPDFGTTVTFKLPRREENP